MSVLRTVYCVTIMPIEGYKFWNEMFTFLCSSEDKVIFCVLKYLGDFHNILLPHEDGTINMPTNIEELKELFYSYSAVKNYYLKIENRIVDDYYNEKEFD